MEGRAWVSPDPGPGPQGGQPRTPLSQGKGRCRLGWPGKLRRPHKALGFPWGRKTGERTGRAVQREDRWRALGDRPRPGTLGRREIRPNSPHGGAQSRSVRRATGRAAAPSSRPRPLSSRPRVPLWGSGSAADPVVVTEFIVGPGPAGGLPTALAVAGVLTHHVGLDEGAQTPSVGIAVAGFTGNGTGTGKHRTPPARFIGISLARSPPCVQGPGEAVQPVSSGRSPIGATREPRRTGRFCPGEDTCSHVCRSCAGIR